MRKDPERWTAESWAEVYSFRKEGKTSMENSQVCRWKVKLVRKDEEIHKLKEQ